MARKYLIVDHLSAYYGIKTIIFKFYYLESIVVAWTKLIISLKLEIFWRI